jgi:hypothetical protein
MAAKLFLCLKQGAFRIPRIVNLSFRSSLTTGPIAMRSLDKTMGRPHTRSGQRDGSRCFTESRTWFSSPKSFFVDQAIKGCAVAQAVNCWLPTAAARVRAPVKCGICHGVNGTGAGFLRIRRFPLPIIHSNCCTIFFTIYHPGRAR